MLKFAHFNFNVLNLERSLEFYKEALNLHVAREVVKDNFTLVYLEEDESDFQLELTWMKDRTEPYDLGECEFHLAFVTDQYDEMLKHHQEMGCVVDIHEKFGVYFIADPDGYIMEVVPTR